MHSSSRAGITMAPDLTKCDLSLIVPFSSQIAYAGIGNATWDICDLPQRDSFC